MNSVMWWYTIFRDWLLKWRSLYSSLITWVKPQCATINPICVVFILNSLFASFFPVQIQKVILSLGDYMQAACHACIGGTNVRSEIHKLSAGAPHIVVGTPGRVYDMLSRGHLCEYLAELMSSSSLALFPKLKLDCWPSCRFKIYQDVCSGWSRWDVESGVQRSDLRDLSETEYKHSSKRKRTHTHTPWPCIILTEVF